MASGGNILVAVSSCNDVAEVRIDVQEEQNKRFNRIIAHFIALIAISNYSWHKSIGKLMRMLGGTLMVTTHLNQVTFQLMLPIDNSCNTLISTGIKDYSLLNVANTEFDKEEKSTAATAGLEKNTSHSLLLVISDIEYAQYIKTNLSNYFDILLYDSKESLVETVRSIPLILLIRKDDNQSYLSYMQSGADRVILRMENICRLHAEILRLIKNREMWQESIMKMISHSSIYSVD